MFKPAKMQYSCTCLQYDIDFDKVPQVLDMAKELGFKIEKKKPHKEAAFQREYYTISRAIEAMLKEERYDLMKEIRRKRAMVTRK